jgi:hypothetical protein
MRLNECGVDRPDLGAPFFSEAEVIRNRSQALCDCLGADSCRYLAVSGTARSVERRLEEHR